MLELYAGQDTSKLSKLVSWDMVAVDILRLECDHNSVI